MHKVTELARGKSVTRRVGGLVVRIEACGVMIRGYRKRRWRLVPWDALAGLALKLDPSPRGHTASEWEHPLATITRRKR